MSLTLENHRIAAVASNENLAVSVGVQTGGLSVMFKRKKNNKHPSTGCRKCVTPPRGRHIDDDRTSCASPNRLY